MSTTTYYVVTEIPPRIRESLRDLADLTRTHAAEVLDMAPVAIRPNVRRAVGSIDQAADAVEWATDPAAVAEAVGMLRLRTAELSSLFRDLPDVMSRLLWVMETCACDVLGDEDGASVAAWAGKLAAGD